MNQTKLQWGSLTVRRKPTHAASGAATRYFNDRSRLFAVGSVLVGKYIYTASKPVLSDNKIYVFYLDMNTWKWHAWPRERQTEPRYYEDAPCMELVQDKIYLFGGVEARYKAMHVLDLPTQTVNVKSGGVANDRLMPLSEFSYAYLESMDMIICFGGTRELRGPVTNGLVGYSVNRSSWQKLQAKGRPPFGIAGNACCTVGKDSVWFFGGIDIQNNETAGMHELKYRNGKLRWTEFPVAIVPRSLHSMCCIGEKLLIYGGFKANDLSETAEVVMFDLTTRKKRRFKNRSSAFGKSRDANIRGMISASASHSVVTSGRKMVVFGGGNLKPRVVHIFTYEPNEAYFF